MKTAFFIATLLCLLSLGNNVRAQGYDYGYEPPYWDGSQYVYPQQYDPYYQLHVLHYELYLQQYPGYPIYPSCCFVGSVVVPGSPRARGLRPRPAVPPNMRPMRRR